jgi:hypothetical protein
MSPLSIAAHAHRRFGTADAIDTASRAEGYVPSGELDNVSFRYRSIAVE